MLQPSHLAYALALVQRSAGVFLPELRFDQHITENLFGACEGAIKATREPFQLRRDVEVTLLGLLQAFSSRARLFCSRNEENNRLNLLIDIDWFQDQQG
ncbi:MAG: hypothetical protein WDN08_00640 [Rhizomicrobium sp.]